MATEPLGVCYLLPVQPLAQLPVQLPVQVPLHAPVQPLAQPPVHVPVQDPSQPEHVPAGYAVLAFMRPATRFASSGACRARRAASISCGLSVMLSANTWRLAEDSSRAAAPPINPQRRNCLRSGDSAISSFFP